MGLGTCWVGGTYDRKPCEALLDDGEALVCVAAIGHTPEERTGREKLIRRVAKRSGKNVAELASGLNHSPSWFMSGMGGCPARPLRLEPPGYRFGEEA